MALNIKNPETHALAAELARRLGVSLTQAVTLSLRAQLSTAPEAEAAEASRAEQMAAIARRMAARIGAAGLPDPDDLLDDARGLPKP
jgi:antitoxin VapB